MAILLNLVKLLTVNGALETWTSSFTLVVAAGCRCNIRVHFVAAVFARGATNFIVLHLYHAGLLTCAVKFVFTVMQIASKGVSHLNI